MLLSGELKSTKIELGIINSEFDELKHNIKNSTELPEKYAHLKLAYEGLIAHKREIELKLMDKRKEEERLIIELARLNLKLMDHEKKKSKNVLSDNVKEE